MQPILVKSIEQAIDAIKSESAVHPIGAGTKTLLTRQREGSIQLDCRGMTGVLEYEPTEFTFTARAGTPLSEIKSELDAHGQFIPFDPPFTAQGATLGGAIASGLNGSCSLRFGGARDFILGIRFVDGRGEDVFAGGKVVKNAAGFDLPKFMVGSYGQFGLLTELTLKVFPRPETFQTLLVDGELSEHLNHIKKLILTPIEFDALDIFQSQLYIRIGGSSQTIVASRKRIESILAKPVATCLTEGADDETWEQAGRFAWHRDDSHTLTKVPCQINDVKKLNQIAMETDSLVRVSIGGQLLYFSTENRKLPTLHQKLDLAGHRYLDFCGAENSDRKKTPASKVWTAMRQALDPNGRFDAFSE